MDRPELDTGDVVIINKPDGLFHRMPGRVVKTFPDDPVKFDVQVCFDPEFLFSEGFTVGEIERNRISSVPSNCDLPLNNYYREDVVLSRTSSYVRVLSRPKRREENSYLPPDVEVYHERN